MNVIKEPSQLTAPGKDPWEYDGHDLAVALLVVCPGQWDVMTSLIRLRVLFLDCFGPRVPSHVNTMIRVWTSTSSLCLIVVQVCSSEVWTTLLSLSVMTLSRTIDRVVDRKIRGRLCCRYQCSIMTVIIEYGCCASIISLLVRPLQD